MAEDYANVPMSLADACLVRMSETLADPVLSLPMQISTSIGVTAASVPP